MEKLKHIIDIETDDSLIKRIVAGDSALFEILIRRYNSVLYKIGRSYGFNHHDAQDIMQETLVIGFTELSKFEGRSSYKTWISRIMINKCNYKMKYGYFKNETPTEISESQMQLQINKERKTHTEGVITNKELSLILEKSIQTLPIIYRSVFVLREVEGFSVSETAELLEITPINVKVRLNRAKTLLQKEIEQFYSRTDIYSFNLVYCDAVVNNVFEKINLL